MCPKRVKMKYKPECARYDTPTKEFLDKFLQTYKIEETMLLPQQSIQISVTSIKHEDVSQKTAVTVLVLIKRVCSWDFDIRVDLRSA